VLLASQEKTKEKTLKFEIFGLDNKLHLSNITIVAHMVLIAVRSVGVIIEMKKICNNCEYFFLIGLDCGYCEKPSGQDGGESEIGSSRQETDSCHGFKQKQNI
jgi:hypothetical protein